MMLPEAAQIFMNRWDNILTLCIDLIRFLQAIQHQMVKGYILVALVQQELQQLE